MSAPSNTITPRHNTPLTHNEISVDALALAIGGPDAPIVIDVRIPDDFAADPRLIPASIRRDAFTADSWANEFRGRRVVISCQKGLKISQGAAAILRSRGIDARSLAGGFVGWQQATQPLLTTRHWPGSHPGSSTLWVTRERPKIDRIACPWLIRRFIDPSAEFLFVAPTEVLAVAEKFAAVPFDVDGCFWSHRGGTCTFDTLLDEFTLDTGPLRQLAKIVRGADTAALDLAPEAAGLLAISLGLSRLHTSDLDQLAHGIIIYDALYRWCRESTHETHNWPAGAQTRTKT